MRVCVRVVCVHRRWQSRLCERRWGIGWRRERSISAAQMRGVVQSRGFQSWGCAEWRGDEIRVGGVVQGVWGGRGGERGREVWRSAVELVLGGREVVRVEAGCLGCRRLGLLKCKSGRAAFSAVHGACDCRARRRAAGAWGQMDTIVLLEVILP